MATWRDKTFFDGDKLPADDLNHLDENFDALANGDSGAPTVTASIAPTNMYGTAISSANANHLASLNQNLGTGDSVNFNSVDVADRITGQSDVQIIYDTNNDGVGKFVIDQSGGGGTPRVHIKNSGEVGIATSTPSSQLHVSGDIQLSGNLIGANSIGEDELTDGIVSRSKLKTATGEVSYSSGGQFDSGSVQSAPGGQYGFLYEDNHSPESNLEVNETHATGAMPGAHSSINTGTWTGFTPGSDQSLSYDSRITLMAMADASTIKARQRYIQASPPYDMGDGECGLFIQPEVMKNGRIRNLYIAPDPPWANNGPTDIHPDYEDSDGNKYKTKRVPAITRDYVDSGSADLIEWVAALREAPSTTFPITNEFKNADMALCPHSVHSELRGEICLLDPCTTHDLLLLHDEGEEISQLLMDGYIEIGDPLSRYGPPGVTIRDWKFKNTKRAS